MALRYLHLCQFQFADQDIRIVGTELDGGTSLSGISEPIQIDGGGYWQADFSNADFGGRDDDDRAATLAWRAINAGLGGGQQVVVLFCDRHHQPVGEPITVPHSDDTPFSDDTEYLSLQVSAVVSAVMNGQTDGLNCTQIRIVYDGPKPLIGGERFTHVHPEWGERCYEIASATPIANGYELTFSPPIRGGIQFGDPLDFENPRCVMRRSSAPTNALNMGLWSSASITFVEDMRKPSA